MSRMHTFRVSCTTRAGERLAVTGSSPRLGAWSKPGLLLLDQEQHSDVWEGNVELTEEQQFYRYCVVVVLQHGRVVVRRWENHLHPRKVEHGEGEVDEFGKVAGQVSMQRGWLTEEMVIQFKLRQSGLNIWKRKFAGHKLWLKLTPVNQDVSNGCTEIEDSLDVSELRHRSTNFPIVETAELTAENCERRLQDQFGVAVGKEADAFTLFEVQLINLNTVAFLVDVYGWGEGQSEHEAPDHVGMCYIHSEQLKRTDGKVETTITSMKYQPIGKLQLDYLIIRPVEGLDCDFSLSNRTKWQDSWSALDVGHRGLGNSYTSAQHCSNIRENTIASMRDAALHGADMVEFDVQVSADLVPVIYHEFRLCVQTKTKHGGEIMLEVPVKDLTIDQLHGLKVHHPSEKSAGVVKEFQNIDPEHEPFPTLETALTNLDTDIGFNIEIKFSQLLQDGREEQGQMMEMNLFLDQVLKAVFSFGQDRKIVFSSFNPDVCAMIINKQNRYPALLLTAGVNSKYENYMDPRTWTIPAAIWFSKMVGLLGISAMAEAVLRDPTQIETVKKEGLVIFCWTDEENNKEIVQHLKSLGIHGIIYDRMDQNNSKMVKESVFLQERRKGKSDSGFSSDSGSPVSSPAAAHPTL